MSLLDPVIHHVWSGDIADKLRTLDADTKLIALYSATCVSLSPLGIGQLPLAQLRCDLSMAQPNLVKRLQQLTKINFCTYDFDSEWIWVLGMTNYRHQRPQRFHTLPPLKRLKILKYFIRQQSQGEQNHVI